MSIQTIFTTVTAHMEYTTREQNKNSLLHQLHNGRITSSIFGDIVHHRESTSPDNLIKCIMEYSNPFVKTKTMVWGLANEAQSAYVKHCQFSDKLVPLFWVAYPYTPIIRTSVPVEMNGFVKMAFVSVCMLEVKCPFSIDKGTVTSIHPVTLAQNPMFCLEMHGESPTLERIHKYYHQVQGELAITGMPWCDFIVWTEGAWSICRADILQQRTLEICQSINYPYAWCGT